MKTPRKPITRMVGTRADRESSASTAPVIVGRVDLYSGTLTIPPMAVRRRLCKNKKVARGFHLPPANRRSASGREPGRQLTPAGSSARGFARALGPQRLVANDRRNLETGRSQGDRKAGCSPPNRARSRRLDEDRQLSWSCEAMFFNSEGEPKRAYEVPGGGSVACSKRMTPWRGTCSTRSFTFRA